MLITRSAPLAQFCASLKGVPYIAVDTEFVGERTYFPRLCLIQVAHGAQAAAIDPLAEGLDLTPLRALLLDPSILKVFHAAKSDLGIFYREFGQVPSPIFDTQVAAAACNLGDQAGYGTLVEKLLGVDLDKTSQATDWSLRPLTERQVTYALGDVTHLCRIYERLVEELTTRGRTDWIAEDMAALQDEQRYRVDPREAYQSIRLRRASRQTLCVLRELASWREQSAIQRNLPSSWVLSDAALVEIAQHMPEDTTQLARVRGLKPAVTAGPDGKTLLALVRHARTLPEDAWPALPERRTPSEGQESLVALFQVLLKLCCETHGVAVQMVASREHLDQLAVLDAPDIPCLSGWRRDIFGAEALALRAGQVALTAEGGRVVRVERAPPGASG